MITKSFLLAIIMMMGCGKNPTAISEIRSEIVEVNPAVVGGWSGDLDLGVVKLTLGLTVDREPSGSITAKLNCVQQGMVDLPIDVISLNGDVLKFEVKKLKVFYEGTLNKDGSEIVGKMNQNGVSVALTLKKGQIITAERKRPQEPKPPYSYLEEEVSYENKEAGITLSGTLTLPSSNGTFPAVLLIAGSGPVDRDEAIFGHKPFLVLADHLTKKGIAVLRVDKRGVGRSTGNFTTATSADFANDVLAGIEYLKTRSEIRSIGLLGHSEGGTVGPMVAVKSKDVAFVIMMAGTGVNGEEILYEQGALISRSLGVPEDMIDMNRTFQREAYAILKQEPDIAKAEKSLLEAYQRYVSNAKIESADSGTVLALNNAWFRHFLTYEPAASLKQLHIPVLVLNGERDIQVSSKQNLPAIAAALKEAGNTDFTILELPKHNHVFQTCETGAISEYANIEETMSPTVLNAISDWILKRV